MSDSQFRILGWIIIGVVIIFATSCQITKVEITQSIRAGADPMQASCAISTAAFSESVCMAAMMRKQDK